MDNFRIQKNRETENSGFTLVETLVAISIFTLSVLVMMGVLATGISNTEYAKRKIIAAYLAQEGIEYVRNIRDTYMLYSTTADAGWTAFNNKLAVASCGSTGGCYFNADDLTAEPPPMPITKIPFGTCVGTCPEMLYNDATGVYGYTTGDASGYTRRIRAVQVNQNETKIYSSVTWLQGSGTYTINFSESVYDWIE